MKISKLFKLTFFLFIISTTCLVNSSISADITRNRLNAFYGPAGWDVVFWGGQSATKIIPSDSPEGGSMLRFTFDVGIGDGSDPGNVFFVSPSILSEAYVQFYHKYDSNYTWHPVGNKIVYFYSPGDAQSMACLLEMYGALTYQVWGTNNDIVVYDTGIGRPTRGVWYNYNIHTKVNTSPGSHDGILQVWVNDVLKINRSDIMYFGPGTTVTGWTQIDMAPAYGGAGGANPAVSHSYYDDFYISTTPISGNIPPIPPRVNPNSPINLQIR